MSIFASHISNASLKELLTKYELGSLLECICKLASFETDSACSNTHLVFSSDSNI